MSFFLLYKLECGPKMGRGGRDHRGHDPSPQNRTCNFFFLLLLEDGDFFFSVSIIIIEKIIAPLWPLKLNDLLSKGPNWLPMS